jgi:hypothetical protein
MNRPDRKLAWRTWARLCAVAVVTLLPTVALAADVEVRFESGRLWVRTDDQVTAQRLFDSIAEKTGVDFVIDPDLAARRLHVEIEGLELERALRQLVTEIPGAGGQSMFYAPGDSGKARLVRVAVFGVGRSPAAAPAADRSVEAAVVAAPTPPSADVEAQKKQMIESGMPAETAQKFLDITAETERLQKTPGAAEALIRSERYRAVIREIAEAQGKKK